jgi:hypothetical protein
MVFCTAQSLQMLKSTAGVSLGFFICHGIFALLNLSLSVAAYTTAIDVERKIKRQSIFIYAIWTTVLLIHVRIAVMKMDDLWKTVDTVSTIIVAIGVGIVILYAKMKRISLIDPYVKAGYAVLFKSVPQVALAVMIYQYGKGGLSGIWIFFGHITILTRIVHLWISNREKWDRNTKGSFVSEVWNEISWLVATAAWFAF